MDTLLRAKKNCDWTPVFSAQIVTEPFYVHMLLFGKEDVKVSL